jgi:ABC-type multidrug transport system ATPase subunit
LLNILATLVKPTSGGLAIDGVDAVRFPWQVRPLIGHVPEPWGLPGHLTVDEFLRYVDACRNRTGGAGSGKEVRAELLERVKGDTLIRNLSRGQIQQLSWVAALAPAVRLLLLDEPMSCLDAIAAARFGKVLGGFRDSGGTAVMAANRLPESGPLCDEIAFLHGGRLMKVITAGETQLRPAEVLRSLIPEPGRSPGSSGSGVEPARAAEGKP